MKKGKLLNSKITEIISKMGHTDEIVIADAGLPIPDGVCRIDLSVVKGLPSFLDVLEALLESYECESYILASEISEYNSETEQQIKDMLKDAKSIYLTHEEFKERCKKAKAVIRTGECTPYANIILQSGVIF